MQITRNLVERGEHLKFKWVSLVKLQLEPSLGFGTTSATNDRYIFRREKSGTGVLFN